MPRVPPVSAARMTIGLTLLALTGAVSAPAQVEKTSVTLLAPANGTLVQGAVEFRWRVDSDEASPNGAVTVTHQVAADVSFSQNVTTTTRSCPAVNANCWTALPAGSLKGRHYWRVSLTGARTAASPTWMFQSVSGGYRPDRQRPRLRAFPGAATRGRKAVFVAQVADDRGEARMRVDLLYRNQLVFRAMTLLKPVRWSVRQRFDSRAPLSRSLYPGPYRLCVTAWDRTGNQAKSCSRYLIR